MNGFPVKIKSIRVIDKNEIPVYDIEVPKYHNFILSNNLVVHNSKDISDGFCGALWSASLYKEEFFSGDSYEIADEVNSTDSSDDLNNSLLLTKEEIDSGKSLAVDKSKIIEKVLSKESSGKSVKKFRDKLTPEENALVKDDELKTYLDPYSNDDFLIF